MERTKLHETENIGMSLKGKRIMILAAGPNWFFGSSSLSVPSRYHALDGPQNPTANRTIRRDAMAWTAASPRMIVFKAIVRLLDHVNGRIDRP